MEERVRVLVVSPPAPVWGAQLYLLDTVVPLRERGIELTLGSPGSSPFSELWIERGLPFVDLPLQLHGGLRRADGSDRRPTPAALLRDAGQVAVACRSVARVGDHFDILHSYAIRSHLEVAAAGRLRRQPVILDLVNIVRPGVGRTALRLAARMATLTVANSRATAAVVGERKVHIINPGIDLRRFAPGPADPGVRAELCDDPAAPLVGIVGRLDVRKGIQVLVEAMAQLEDRVSDAQLVVVGEVGTGPRQFAEDLRRKADATLGRRVRFAGRRSDIPAVLRACDVIVNASKAEPFGLSVLEAQACGTPVIGTDAGGIPEFVEHGVNGLLVPPFQPAPLARALERVLGDRGFAASLADAAVQRVHPARGLDCQYDELASTYRSVLPISRRPSDRRSGRGPGSVRPCQLDRKEWKVEDLAPIVR